MTTASTVSVPTRSPTVTARLRSLCAVGGVLVLLAVLGCTSDSSSRKATQAHAASPASTQAGETATPPASTPAAAPGSTRTVADRLQDASVAARVTQALVQTDRLRVFEFEPTAVRGHVTLQGDVNTRAQYRLAERVARETDGVTGVTNALTIGGRPPSDSTDAASSGGSGRAAYHTVQPGESLWTIARQYQASVDQLRQLNDLGGRSLQPGERVRVR